MERDQKDLRADPQMRRLRPASEVARLDGGRPYIWFRLEASGTIEQHMARAASLCDGGELIRQVLDPT